MKRKELIKDIYKVATTETPESWLDKEIAKSKLNHWDSAKRVRVGGSRFKEIDVKDIGKVYYGKLSRLESIFRSKHAKCNCIFDSGVDESGAIKDSVLKKAGRYHGSDGRVNYVYSYIGCGLWEVIGLDIKTPIVIKNDFINKPVGKPYTYKSSEVNDKLWGNHWFLRPHQVIGNKLKHGDGCEIKYPTPHLIDPVPARKELAGMVEDVDIPKNSESEVLIPNTLILVDGNEVMASVKKEDWDMLPYEIKDGLNSGEYPKHREGYVGYQAGMDNIPGLFYSTRDFEDFIQKNLIKIEKESRRKKISQIHKSSRNISQELYYHIDNGLSILDNVFRPTSDKYFQLISEAKRNLGFVKLSSNEMEIMKTDIGDFGIDEETGERVPLDFPLPNEEYFEKEAAEYNGKKVKLNRPMRSSGPKKYKVYVKNPKTGRVKKINFGDSKGGLRLNIHDAAARRSFVARHKCKKKNDKMKAGYWACRIGRYPHLVGGKKRYTWW